MSSDSQNKVVKMQDERAANKRFEGKVVLVTGAGKGIGRQIATAFAAEGAWVAVNDITPINLDETIRQIQAAGGTARDYVADISVKMSVQVMVDQILEVWKRIDILINNAEVKPTRSLLDLDAWDWQRTLDVNLSGPFYAIQTVGDVMRSQGGGVIVNIASSTVQLDELCNQAAYMTSKMGLMGLSQVAAQELAAYNIRVNALCPGAGENEIPARLWQDEAKGAKWLEGIHPDQLGITYDIAEMVLSLCSEEAAHLNGQIINFNDSRPI
jgi:NAD(P)-dependent dehydrogenase (short-subunit alcohol dehydrogenase family)